MTGVQTCALPICAIAKTYFADKMNIDPKNIVVVSVMPCLAKKYEAARDELKHDNLRDVDIVITTRELAKMIKEAGIDFNSLKDDDFDDPLGESTGAAVIFGASGGVLEAAVRTAYEWVTGKTGPPIEFHSIRGLEGSKSATIEINDMLVNVAVTSGLGNARKLLESIKSGESSYHIIEIMACPGGCIGGGGQPYSHGDVGILNKRVDAIYKEDNSKAIRKSHENPSIKKLYSEFLGEPYGEKAHELLHIHFIDRKFLKDRKSVV